MIPSALSVEHFAPLSYTEYIFASFDLVNDLIVMLLKVILFSVATFRIGSPV